MPHPRSRCSRRALASPILAFAALLAAATPARAQDEPCTEEPCNEFPTLGVTPGSAPTSQPGGVSATFTARDRENGVDTLSFVAYLNGQDVSDRFSITREDYEVPADGTIEVRYHFRWTVPLTRQMPVATLTASICDTGGLCADSARATYTLVIPGVEVTPKGGSVTAGRATTRTRTFTVVNRGTATATFQLVPACRVAETGAAFTPCSVSLPGVTLAPDNAREVTVTYDATRVDVPLTVALSARQADQPTVRDGGWVDVTLYGGSGGASAPAVRLVDLNSGPQIDRARCVTVAAGAGAAYECGDLRLVHALPAITTAGRVRAPVLIYNSQHAHPRPTVYADVTLPTGAGAPDSMVATVTLADTVIRRSWPGQAWRPGTTRRVAVQWDGLETETGVYPYSLQVAGRYGADSHYSAVHSGQLTVVNRSESPFGAGWWLAGLEQLVSVLGGTAILLVQGDGSTRLFTPVDGQTYVATPVDRPDTLRAEWTGTHVHHFRRLPGGTTVYYDTAGRHYRTLNRLGHLTSFAYDGQGRLQAVYPPSWSREALWWFTRDPATGALLNVCAHVTDVGCRYVGVERDAATGRVTGLQDPDGFRVRFGYGSAGNRVLTRTNRRGAVTRFEYDGAGRLSSARLPLAAGDTIVTRFTAAEGRGVGASVALVDAHTLLDGPRADVADLTRIWVGRWGAPVRIRDAVGAETRIRRDDDAFPGLATEVVTPGGLHTEARYDARGRVDTTLVYDPLDDGRNALTTYAWDDRWDAPTRTTTYEVTDSTVTQLVGSTHTEYDAATGNPVSQRQGESLARQATFRYYGPGSGAATGLPRAIQSPADAQGQVAVDSLWYDDQGNLKGIASPLGFLTLRYRDPLGRDTLTITPIDSATARDTVSLKASGARQRTVYDVMDRDTLTLTYGPGITHAGRGNLGTIVTPAEQLSVRTTYDPEGLPLRVARRATPDSAGVDTLVTEYEYDPAGRKRRETDGAQTQRFDYDHSGNVTAWTTGRGYVVTSSYDAANRLATRAVPRVQHPRSCFDACAVAFPYYPNDTGGSLVIPEEWTYFRYDSAGSLAYAENRDAIVQRSYFPNGLVNGDTSRLRSYSEQDFTRHVYGLEYAYDLLGRPVRQVHPGRLTPGGNDTDAWEYDPQTGALAAAQSRYGLRFTFGYDDADRLITVRGPGGSYVDSLAYDREGRRRQRAWASVLGSSLTETFTHDARGKLLAVSAQSTADIGTGASDYHQWYSGLGNLAATDWDNHQNPEFAIEQFRSDALGNVYWRRSGSAGTWSTAAPHRTHYAPRIGRVEMIERLPSGSLSDTDYEDVTMRTYDASGNAQDGRQDVSSHLQGDTATWSYSRSRSFYGADERLRYHQEQALTTSGSTVREQGVWEEYRYDPLGRRILVRSNRDELCDQFNSGACVSHITRFVWSGDQLLWELRARGESGASLDAESSGGPLHGTVSYFHAGAIDRPLVIMKNDTSIIPHQNWRGQFAFGTYAGGQVSDCTGQQTTPCANVPWPGYRTTAWHLDAKPQDIRTWYGGLVDDLRDETGKMYRRNRYYDPQTGQFTQPDPIGLAGGLNAYGFAEGDPVSYSDPYGFKAEDCRKVRCPKNTREVVENKQIQQFAQQLMAASLMDAEGAEYGAHIVRQEDGSLSLVNVTRGQRGVVYLPDPPDNAIAEIHTHPDQPVILNGRVTDIPFEFPSGNDAVRANAFNVYGIVVSPHTFSVIPVGRYTYHNYPRTQTLMPPAACTSRTICPSPYK
ncbi:MAG TPA: RHS repeat-associated core domain-containing protein [Longimicrobium sp.]|nr:RHS repeat-associated core domain-containing protein [Longimicrobium sp.]